MTETNLWPPRPEAWECSTNKEIAFATPGSASCPTAPVVALTCLGKGAGAASDELPSRALGAALRCHCREKEYLRFSQDERLKEILLEREYGIVETSQNHRFGAFGTTDSVEGNTEK